MDRSLVGLDRHCDDVRIALAVAVAEVVVDPDLPDSDKQIPIHIYIMISKIITHIRRYLEWVARGYMPEPKRRKRRKRKDPYAGPWRGNL